ncbi:FecCD family ABC transporter permease [Eudoraea chungangensis]|uniref:FecCD family ABC transporter permease n=1 Tax=Eudoraea chungangensis TaxID=1481905 RepID=UPI0023ECA384|nr:iron ABC transporter permease [Eudoraea chungangensis]
MKTKSPYTLSFTVLILALLVFFLLNLSLGSVNIPLEETIQSIFGAKIENESWEYIIRNYRIPKAFTAVLVGGGLSLSGLIMQTLFRNPLAGPFVLGISSGASLGAALLIMGSGLLASFFSVSFANDVSLAIASSIGSFIVLLVVLGMASRVKDTMALLIIGLMFGSISAAVVSVLSYFTDAERLQQYIFWAFGSVGNLSWSQVALLAGFVAVGILITIAAIKSLNSLLLGENYAQSLGVPVNKIRFFLIIATGLLAGSITAFAGPIAFIGLAVPHLTRQLFNTTEHKILVPGVLILGAIILLLCDIIAQVPSSYYVLPLNAITTIIGAPVVIWLLVRRKKMIF